MGIGLYLLDIFNVDIVVVPKHHSNILIAVTRCKYRIHIIREVPHFLAIGGGDKSPRRILNQGVFIIGDIPAPVALRLLTVCWKVPSSFIPQRNRTDNPISDIPITIGIYHVLWRHPDLFHAGKKLLEVTGPVDVKESVNIPIVKAGPVEAYIKPDTD